MFKINASLNVRPEHFVYNKNNHFNQYFGIAGALEHLN